MHKKIDLGSPKGPPGFSLKKNKKQNKAKILFGIPRGSNLSCHSIPFCLFQVSCDDDWGAVIGTWLSSVTHNYDTKSHLAQAGLEVCPVAETRLALLIFLLPPSWCLDDRYVHWAWLTIFLQLLFTVRKVLSPRCGDTFCHQGSDR